MRNKNSQLVMTYTGPFYESLLQIIISAKYVVKKKNLFAIEH